MDKVGRERINGKRRVPVERHRKPGRGEQSYVPSEVRELTVKVARLELTRTLRPGLGEGDEALLLASVERWIEDAKRRTKSPIATTGPAGTSNLRRLKLVLSPEYERLSDRELAILSVLAGLVPLADFDFGGVSVTGRAALRAEEKRIRNARLGRAKLSPYEATIDAPRRPRRG